MPTLLEQIIAKHKEDRIRIKELKARHAEELRVIEEFQSKREAALLEHCTSFDMEVFSYVTDLFINGRDGKAEAKKTEANISLDQTKLERWLLAMLGKDGQGVKTSFGTVFKTRRESVTVGDFETFIDVNMLAPAAAKVAAEMGYENEAGMIERVLKLIHSNMHLELLNKAVNKTAVLELMGEKAKDGSYQNPPPDGINYVSISAIGVNKPK